MLDKMIEKFMEGHKVIDCMVCQFLKETGYSVKDIKIIRRDSENRLTTTFTVAHKNTPNKYLITKEEDDY